MKQVASEQSLFDEDDNPDVMEPTTVTEPLVVEPTIEQPDTKEQVAEAGIEEHSSEHDNVAEQPVVEPAVEQSVEQPAFITEEQPRVGQTSINEPPATDMTVSLVSFPLLYDKNSSKETWLTPPFPLAISCAP